MGTIIYKAMTPCVFPRESMNHEFLKEHFAANIRDKTRYYYNEDKNSSSGRCIPPVCVFVCN